MASPSTVLSQGYGSWGSVHLLPTLGFGAGIGVVIVPDIPGMEWSAAENRFHFGLDEPNLFHAGGQENRLHFGLDEDARLHHGGGGRFHWTSEDG